MRISVFHACLGLLGISSLAGCRHDNCVCSNRPMADIVVRKDVMIAETPRGTPGPATISGWSRPIPPLPVIDHDGPDQPNSVTAAQGGLKPEMQILVPRGTTGVIIDTTSLTQEHSRLLNINTLVVGASDPAILPQPAHGDREPPAAVQSVPIQSGGLDDYKSLTGQVQMWRQTVRLRYAPIDKEDKYGGFVILEGGAELTRLREGQHVRIRGVLIAPENRNGVAHYRVQAMEVLD